MKIAVGSLNPVKNAAVIEACKEHGLFAGAAFMPCDVPSGVDKQPKSLESLTFGALRRARNARDAASADLGVGIESGVFRVSAAESGWLDVSACVITDGRRTYVGLSPAFEVPADAMAHIERDGVDLSEAARRAGYTGSAYVGYEDGIIGVLSGGHVTRKDLARSAVEMALVLLIRASKRP